MKHYDLVDREDATKLSDGMQRAKHDLWLNKQKVPDPEPDQRFLDNYDRIMAMDDDTVAHKMKKHRESMTVETGYKDEGTLQAHTIDQEEAIA